MLAAVAGRILAEHPWVELLATADSVVAAFLSSLEDWEAVVVRPQASLPKLLCQVDLGAESPPPCASPLAFCLPLLGAVLARQ